MKTLMTITELSKIFPVTPQKTENKKMLFKPRQGPQQSYLHAVDDISFEIFEGESLGVVGESGCGKSTLVNMLCRLTDPTKGSIVFAGKTLSHIPARRFAKAPERADIQVVFQDPHESLNPRHTAFESIAEPLLRIGSFKRGDALQRRVHELAANSGLPDALLSRFPHQLSGGQKARVNIARAIALTPKLLVLDEPTSALDVSVQARILQLLDDLRSKLGMSYMFVTHDLNVVRLLCDRVLVMYLGKIVEIGPTAQVFDAPLHPYTEALISAIPTLDAKVAKNRMRLTGEPLSPIDPDPNTCRFYGRCPKGWDECTQNMPQLLPGKRRDHLAACHLKDVS